ncbi:hypothetical protein ACFLRA_02470 [Bdellovibrionota bacterium]
MTKITWHLGILTLCLGFILIIDASRFPAGDLEMAELYVPAGINKPKEIEDSDSATATLPPPYSQHTC